MIVMLTGALNQKQGKGATTMTGQIDMFEPPKKLTQTDRILRHLKDHKTITSKVAMDEYGIYRLASRISDLKKAGYEITSKTITAKNRYHENTHFSEYSLVQ